MRALIVYDYGGPPLHYFLPIWQARARTAVYIPRPTRLDSTELAYLRGCGVELLLDVDSWDRRDEDETVRRITAAATAWGADAVATFSELYSVPTAIAAEKLELRGASASGARCARDKGLMRDALAAAGLTRPTYRSATSPTDIAHAMADSGGPVLIKPRRGMSTAGIQLVNRPEEIESAFALARESLSEFDVPADLEQAFLVEELLIGDAAAWYSARGLSDQICVEGLVVDGKYVPVAITDVIPKVPLFTQSGHVSPTSLDTSGQVRVLETARRAVDSLKLSTCGTHVELKLMADGDCAVVEIAARYAGRTIVPQTDYACGLDLVGAYADALLYGRASVLPCEPGQLADRAAATLYLYASECMRTLTTPFPYAGMTPPAGLVAPSVRIRGFTERRFGWVIKDRSHEQPYWFAQLYLEATSLSELLESVARVRRDVRLLPSEAGG